MLSKFILLFIFKIGIVRASNFRLANYYGDHMVLQMEPFSAVIWGYADIGASITLDFKGDVYKTTAVAAHFTSVGVWKVTLAPQPPSGPFTITVTSYSHGTKESTSLEDVLFGDVWVCSGQSNMAFDVKQAFNGSAAMGKSYKYSQVRVISISQLDSPTPLYDVTLYKPWSRPNPDVLGQGAKEGFLYFSAVCYFYGLNLYNHLKYPIGLISSNWGGTPIEAWSSPEVLKQCGVTAKSLNYTYSGEKKGIGGPHDPSGLWNGMIHPLVNMTIKGAIWYQGEANTVNPGPYKCLFPAMIEDWRKTWYEGTGKQSDPTFSFGFAQIATSGLPVKEPNSNYTALRWHQTYDYGFVPNPHLPNVFMSVTVDLIDLDSPYGTIHPRYKQDVADRLSLGARAVAYGEEDVVYQGPFPTVVQLYSSSRILVKFNDSAITLRMNNASGFEACCKTSPSHCPLVDAGSPWSAVTDYELGKSQVIFTDPCVAQGFRASMVRYNWHDLACKSYKQCQLYDANSNLPAPPFIKSISDN